MGIVERRERQRTEVKEKILAAARELFVRHGFENVSMRQIAEAIEYSPTAIYLHFADKGALFAEIVSQDFASLAGEMRKIEKVADPIDRIRRAGRAYIRFAVAHPNHYRLMFMTAHEEMPKEKLDDHTPDADAYAFLRTAVEHALERGLFRPELRSAELIAQTLWAAVHGVASLEIVKLTEGCCQWRPMRERAETMLDAILRGLCLPDGSNP
jgi:AcrR family transcriptional regulator